MTSPPTVVSILCPHHSGSTLLDLVLGSHPAVASAGELKALFPFSPRRRKRPKLLHARCACGVKPALDCPFWSAVDVLLRDSVGPLQELRVDTRRDAKFRSVNRALLAAIAEASRASFVVDSSKSPRRHRRLREVAGLRVRPLLLVRDPRGVVFSQMRKGRGWLRAALDCRRYWAETRRAVRGDAPIVVSYERFAREPARTLDRVMSELGLESIPGQLDWRAHAHHNFAGNRMRHSTSSAIRPDEEWMRSLPRGRASVVRWLARPVLPTEDGWRQPERGSR